MNILVRCKTKIYNTLIDVTWSYNTLINEIKKFVKVVLTINMYEYGGF